MATATSAQALQRWARRGHAPAIGGAPAAPERESGPRAPGLVRAMSRGGFPSRGRGLSAGQPGDGRWACYWSRDGQPLQLEIRRTGPQAASILLNETQLDWLVGPAGQATLAARRSAEHLAGAGVAVPSASPTPAPALSEGEPPR